jgi:ABC-type Mn2+/Zn2+ transport system permease subunit
MWYFIAAIIFGIIGAFFAAYWTRNQHLDTDDYAFGAFLIGVFGAAWIITVPMALTVGVGMLLFKVFRKIVKGEIKFVKDV